MKVDTFPENSGNIHETADKLSFTKKGGQALEEVVQESLGITILLSVQEMYGCGTWEHSLLMNTAVLVDLDKNLCKANHHNSITLKNCQDS